MSPTYPMKYAQRMLNPFHGVMHIVKLHWSEAVTTDGENWILYIRGERFYDDLQDETGGLASNITVADIKYGIWSAGNGLKRSPVRLPTLYDEIEQEGQLLLDTVIHSQPELPFDFADRHELWLLDAQNNEPLALISSRCSHEPEEAPPLLQWNAGMQARQYHSEIARLQKIVNQLAGKTPVTRWFDRAHSNLPEHELNTQLLQSEKQAMQILMRWQAPYCLLLQQTPQQRSILEELACRHADRLTALLNLLPEVINSRLIQAARVESRMRASLKNIHQSEQTQTQRPIAPFYLELDD